MTELAEGLSLGTRFRLVSMLGEGGMGQVWLATDIDRNTTVALKILNAELAAQQGFVDLLKDECAKASGLLHPNIVRVYEAHDEAGFHFISMEYVKGESLQQLRGSSWRTVVQTLLPLTDALSYAHQRGVVHRDVTPANVLLDKAGKPRLLDFGIASFLDGDSANALRSGGSLPAMSPQQLAGADPATSDDIYAFGSLFYDLISGAPLFSGNISADRVTHEEPPPLEAAADNDLPPQLQQLIAAMLSKDPRRRPAGMAAVRAALEELLADTSSATNGDDTQSEDDGTIRPVSRSPADSSVSQNFRPLQSTAKTAIPEKFVYGGIGLLALLLIVVIFVLPGVVESDRQEESAQTETIEQPAPAEAAAEDAVVDAERAGNRELADSALADLLELEDRLKALGIETWGGADWAAVRSIVNAGDEAYKDRLYGVATETYRDALAQMQPFEARAADVLATAIQDGNTAIEAGKQLLALERFDLALLIEQQNSQALAGRERALQLDKVLALVDQASAAELGQRWADALSAYEQALALDAQWGAALEGRERMRAAISGNNYQLAMSAGYAALAAQDYGRARREFEGALRARAGDADARAAIAQVDAERKLARIVGLSKEAAALQASEQWAEAVKRYEEIIRIDPAMVTARSGLEQSSNRADLDVRMRQAIASPDRLGDDAVWDATNALLQYANKIESTGPVLAGQVSELNRLLERARVLVPVRLQSDSETEIVIYKVGKLGRFASRDIELKPGVYTVVGARSGYRDVRRNFRVAPEAGLVQIEVRCEDPI